MSTGDPDDANSQAAEHESESSLPAAEAGPTSSEAGPSGLPDEEGDVDGDVMERITLEAAAADADASAIAAEEAEEIAVAARAALAAANEIREEASLYAQACVQAVEEAPANREAAIEMTMQLENQVAGYEAGAQRVAAAAALIEEESQKATRFAAGARRAGAKWAMNATRKAKQLESDMVEARAATQQAMDAVVTIRAQAEAAIGQVEEAMDEEQLCGPRATEAQAAAVAATAAAAAAARECASAEAVASLTAAEAEAARKTEKRVRAMTSLFHREMRRGFAGWEERWLELLHEQELMGRAVRNMLTRQLKRGFFQWHEAKEDLMHNEALLQRGIAHQYASARARAVLTWYETRCERRTYRGMTATARTHAIGLELKHGLWAWMEANVRRRHDLAILRRGLEAMVGGQLRAGWVQWKDAFEALRATERDAHERAMAQRTALALSRWKHHAARSTRVKRTLREALVRIWRLRLTMGWAAWRSGDENRAAALSKVRECVRHWAHQLLGAALTHWHGQTVWRAVMLRKLRNGDATLLRLVSGIASRDLANAFVRWRVRHERRQGQGSDLMSVAARYFGKSAEAPSAAPAASPAPPPVPSTSHVLDDEDTAEFWRQMNEIRNGTAQPLPPVQSPLPPSSARLAPKSPPELMAPRPASARPGRTSPLEGAAPAHPSPPAHRPPPMSPMPGRSTLFHQAKLARAKRSARVRAI